MDMIILCTIFYSVLIFIEIVPLYKQNKMGQFWFYSSILLLTYIIHVLNSLGVAIPSPAGPLKQFVQWIFPIQV